MKLLLSFVTLILINLSCAKNELPYDEIHLSAMTDSSYIEIIIERDSIIYYEIERRDCDGWGNCEFGTRFSCHSIRDSTQLISYLKTVKIVLSDTFIHPRIQVTHGSTNSLVILCKDSILKKFSYYDIKDESEILRSLGHLICKAIETGDKQDISYSSRLFDLSPIKYVDSIRISNTQLHHPPKDSLKQQQYYIKNEKIKTIKNKDTIANILTRIPLLSIIQSPILEEIDKTNFNPQYVLALFRNNLIKYTLYADEKILSYNHIQWLKVDSTFINYIK